MKRIFKYVFKYKWRLMLGLVIKVVGTVMDLAIPYIMSMIVDDLIPEEDLKSIIVYGLVMIVCAIIGFTFNVIANRMAAYIAKVTTQDLRYDLFNKIEDLSSAQIDEVTMPSLISRMSTDTYNIYRMVGMMQRIGIRAPILLIGGIVVTLTLDSKLTLILLGLLPIIVIITVIISKIGIPLFSKVQLAMDDMTRTLRENITGIRVIKALTKENYERGKFQKVNKNVMDYELKSGKTMATLNPMISFLLNAGLVLVIVYGAMRVSAGETQVGKIISFISYFTIILNAVLTITRIFNVYSRAYASALRIDYVFNLPKDLEKQNQTELVNPNNHIEFQDVSFSYNGKKDNLSNINFALKKGESLGIIGSTGAGKTTLIQLLMRFYDPNSGIIRINGRDIREYEANELKKEFGVVFQNDNIFSDTIKENIKFGRNISDEDIDLASNVAMLSNYIESNKDGYDYFLLPKGNNLSGGQKQRVYIARALANKPNILILDDASSALDYKIDSLLRAGIKEHYQGITMIVVAQRISSIMHCDKILVLEDGKINGYGTHDDLLSSSPIYQEIYTSQMGGSIS